jgi:hypothetical protein
MKDDSVISLFEKNKDGILNGIIDIVTHLPRECNAMEQRFTAKEFFYAPLIQAIGSPKLKRIENIRGYNIVYDDKSTILVKTGRKIFQKETSRKSNDGLTSPPWVILENHYFTTPLFKGEKKIIEERLKALESVTADYLLFIQKGTGKDLGNSFQYIGFGLVSRKKLIRLVKKIDFNGIRYNSNQQIRIAVPNNVYDVFHGAYVELNKSEKFERNLADTYRKGKNNLITTVMDVPYTFKPVILSMNQIRSLKKGDAISV